MNFAIRSALAGAGLALCAAAAPAAAFTAYHGGGYVGNFVGCEAQGWSGVQAVTARMVPAGLPENNPEAHTLVVQLGEGTHSYRIPATLEQGDWVDVEAWEVWQHLPHQFTNVQVRMRADRRASDFVGDLSDLRARFHVQIENFNGLAGCNALMGLTLRQRG